MSIESPQDSSTSLVETQRQEPPSSAAPSYFSAVANFFYSFFQKTTPTPPLEASRVAVKMSAPFLFKITGRDIPTSQPVYILGVHPSLTTQELPAEVIGRMASCDVLVCTTPEDQSKVKERFAQFIREMQKQYQEPDIAKLKSKMEALGFTDQDDLIKELPARIQEFKVWGPHWVGKLSVRTREKLEQVLGEYGLKLSELHPLLVKAVLMHRIALPKMKTFENDMIQRFKDQQKEIKFVESLPEFSSDFEEIVADWEDVFDVHNTLALFEKMSSSSDALQNGVKSTYDNYATGKKKLDLKRFEASNRGCSFGSNKAKDLWDDRVKKMLSLKQSAAIVVSYEMLEGPSGLLSLLGIRSYQIEKL